MADYDSDSSGGDGDIATNVLLGYASQDPTGDDFSQLGGRPTWLDSKTAASGAFAKCKVCNGVLSLLLQLNGDLPDWFPGHERRVYLFGCRRKACRRKDGSVRALRAVRVSQVEATTAGDAEMVDATTNTQPAMNIGETLFGVKPATTSQVNPFASASSQTSAANPFSMQKGGESVLAPNQASGQSNGKQPASFAEKARTSTSQAPATTTLTTQTPADPWPDDPTPYPASFVDADKEYLEAEPDSIPTNATLDSEGGSSTAAEEKALFESFMDKTFQSFADRLSQNPEQILRYEFAGQPLLYSKDDAVGKLLSPTVDAKVQTSSSRNGNALSSASRMPRCKACGTARVFELQLTPHAITELEKDEVGIDGTDWGTLILGVCSQDCVESEKTEGEVSYFEEWVGVQWEELAGKK